MTTLKRIKMVTFIYAVITLFTHLTALFLAIYRLMTKTVSQTMLNRTDELLSVGFLGLCFGFMVIAATLLLTNSICAAGYLRLHEIFWLTQFTGYWIFKLIMRQVTEYAQMDLYWRFIKVFSYDLTPCLILLPAVIWWGVHYKNHDSRRYLF